MKKLVFALLLILFCSTPLMADDNIYSIEVTNTTQHNKIFMVYHDWKENVHEIGMDPPEISIKLKPLESKNINLKAGKYSIIEKIPSLHFYRSYGINVPQDLATEQVMEMLKQQTTL